MIRAIWRALRRMGFDGGRVLEPGCGTGLFFALCPEALVGKLALTGVEMDPTTARIAKLLYPNALIRHEDFTKAKLPELYDLAIGNPPFSDRTVRADDPAGELRLSVHDYFIARSVERLRPGGLAAFVTSRWTMDKVDGKARQQIAAMADLIGAVRLPEGAMHDRAGTEVVVDNPRKIQPGELSDTALGASIKAVGILQPPAATEKSGELTIAYGAGSASRYRSASPRSTSWSKTPTRATRCGR
jgi:SAM-dependent methyltransferase